LPPAANKIDILQLADAKELLVRFKAERDEEILVAKRFAEVEGNSDLFLHALLGER
jgi:hypothetical protein